MDVLKLYLQLCWFKNNPLQLPASGSFLQKNLIFHVVLIFLTLANMIPPLDAFAEVLAETALTLLFVALILSLNHTMHVFIQVSSAIFACVNVVFIFAVPVVVWLVMTHDWLSYLSLAVVIIWSFSLLTYMMQKVLAVDIFASFIVAFLYFSSTYGFAYALTLLF